MGRGSAVEFLMRDEFLGFIRISELKVFGIVDTHLHNNRSSGAIHLAHALDLPPNQSRYLRIGSSTTTGRTASSLGVERKLDSLAGLD